MSISNIHTAYTVAEWCERNRISPAKLYLLWKAGDGPAYYRIGRKVLIRAESDERWRAEREAAQAAAA
jgi:hypothetical protein